MASRAHGAVVTERRWSRLLLGDWTPAVRDPVDLIRMAYLGGAVWCLVIGDGGTALRFALTFVAGLLPRFLAAPRLFDFFFSATLGLQAWGNLLGWFGHGTLFDRFDHVLSPMGVAPLFYLWLVRRELVPDLHEETRRFSWLGILVVGFSIGVTVGTLYEFWEFAANRLGGQLFTSYEDTILDLIMDAIGALVGSAVLALWAQAGWGSRRLPGRPAA